MTPPPVKRDDDTAPINCRGRMSLSEKVGIERGQEMEVEGGRGEREKEREREGVCV